MKQLFIALAVILLFGHHLNAQSKKQATMQTNNQYTILLLMQATPKWLSLSRDERAGFFQKTILPVFIEVNKTVSVKFFDSEYFHSRVSDFLIIETGHLQDYKLLIEKLRDTKIYSEPYFEITDIIPGQENAFRDFDAYFKKNQP